MAVVGFQADGHALAKRVKQRLEVSYRAGNMSLPTASVDDGRGMISFESWTNPVAGATTLQ